jgi:hypothetical protein
MIFAIFFALNIRFVIFWVVTPCSLVRGYDISENRIGCLCVPLTEDGLTVKMGLMEMVVWMRGGWNWLRILCSGVLWY